MHVIEIGGGKEEGDGQKGTGTYGEEVGKERGGKDEKEEEGRGREGKRRRKGKISYPSKPQMTKGDAGVLCAGIIF